MSRSLARFVECSMVQQVTQIGHNFDGMQLGIEAVGFFF